MANYVSIRLGGHPAEKYLRLIAQDYASHVCLSRLANIRMWNEPWRAKGLSFGDWMRGIDRERIALREVLESAVAGERAPFGVPLPDVGVITWHIPDYSHIGKKQSYPSFSAERVRGAADRFSKRYLTLLGLEVAPLLPCPAWLNEDDVK